MFKIDVVQFIQTVWLLLEQCTIGNFINDEYTKYLGGGKKIVVMAKMAELIKSPDSSLRFRIRCTTW
jgi:hypothetical protein